MCRRVNKLIWNESLSSRSFFVVLVTAFFFSFCLVVFLPISDGVSRRDLRFTAKRRHSTERKLVSRGRCLYAHNLWRWKHCKSIPRNPVKSRIYLCPLSFFYLPVGWWTPSVTNVINGLGPPFLRLLPTRYIPFFSWFPFPISYIWNLSLVPE